MPVDFAQLIRDAEQRKQKEQSVIANSPAAQKAGDHLLEPKQAIREGEKRESVTPEGKYHDAVSDYVTGKTDKQPRMFDFLANKTQTEKQKQNDSVQPGNPRDLLYGTGITKKASERSARTAEKAMQQTTIATDAIADQINVLNLKPAVTSVKDITLDKYQATALEGMREQKFACLIGAAGTGKTTVTKQLVETIYDQLIDIDLNDGLRDEDRENTPIVTKAIFFCAFTGRAVQQIKRALPSQYHRQCATIHKMLGYAPEMEEYFDEETKMWKERKVFRPTFTASNKLPYKVIFIDESGMTPIPLWNEVIAACQPDTRIFLIGDINQLPPVMGRSVLGFAMLKWPTFTLEHIHRQAADNPVLMNAHRILQGKLPIPDSKHFAMVKVSDASTEAFTKTINAIRYLHGQKNVFDPFQDALIVPQNVGTIGQVHINERLVAYFNPEKETDGFIQNKRYVITAGYTHVAFAVGDKVMLLQNDNTRQLTNGMTGVVTEITQNGNFRDERGNASLAMTGDVFEIDDDADLDFTNLGDSVVVEEEIDEEKESQRQASHIMTVKFGAADGEREVSFSTAGQYRQICHAYAFTCHKSQGGEYPTVVILCHSANARMLNREWLYTAVTRAQERVILLHNDRGLLQAVNNQTIRGKSVAEKAKSFLALQKDESTIQPNLPEPEKV